jgi:anti-anti-sigma factor
VDTFEKEYRGNVVVITVNLVSATLNDTNEFKGFMEELVLLTECDVVVDLGPCNHLDSTFIGALVMSYKKLKVKNRYMVLVEPNDQTKVFLTMNSLSKIFHLYPNVEVAVEDLLNRKVVEENLTNGNHKVVIDNKPDESVIDENSVNKEVVVDNTSENVTENELVTEVIKEEVIEEKVEELIPQETIQEKVENIAVNTSNETDQNIIPEKIESKVEENVDESVANKNLLKEVENIIETSKEAEIIDPTNVEEELVEDFDNVERDYTQGTVAWDFGV